jgi:urease accessory protein
LTLASIQLTRHRRQPAAVAVLTTLLTLLLAAPAAGHEDQVIEYGSFLAGLTHPVLGLDHLLAMVSVGIVSAIIGGRAIWTVPSMFVIMMAVGGVTGWLFPEVFAGTITEVAIALSVMFLGGVIVWGRAIPTAVAMAAVAFFGFFHGYAHGSEIPDIADTLVYAIGFLLGTALLHLTGVLIGEVAKRYQYGLAVLRGAGMLFVVIGASFFLEAL